MKKLLKKSRYIIEYLIVLLITKLLRLTTIDTASRICGNVARKLGPFLPVTKIARENMQQILGRSDDQMVDALWDNFGRFIGEFPHTIDIEQSEIDKRIELEGLEHIAAFQENRQPFLLFTGHFANWDFLLLVIEKLYPLFGIVYRKANNPYVDKMIIRSRARKNIHLIPKGVGGAKDLVKCIKSGYSIAMLVDQKMNDGIAVPFFNRPAMTAHAIAKLALQFNYPIIPAQMIRKKGSHFKVIIHPPLTFTKTENNEQDCYNIMLCVNQILEKWILEKPEQWFWFHNRWRKRKTRG